MHISGTIHVQIQIEKNMSLKHVTTSLAWKHQVRETHFFLGLALAFFLGWALAFFLGLGLSSSASPSSSSVFLGAKLLRWKEGSGLQRSSPICMQVNKQIIYLL